MSKAISTLIIDMYGVILKERTGNFISYTYEHFDSSEHNRIRNLLENDKLFTKAGLGEMTSHEFLSTLGYEDTEYHMKNYIENYLTFDPSFLSFAETCFSAASISSAEIRKESKSNFIWSNFSAYSQIASTPLTRISAMISAAAFSAAGG